MTQQFDAIVIGAGVSVHEARLMDEHHKRVLAADGFRMRSKAVLLLNNAEPLPNVLFLL